MNITYNSTFFDIAELFEVGPDDPDTHKILYKATPNTNKVTIKRTASAMTALVSNCVYPLLLLLLLDGTTPVGCSAAQNIRGAPETGQWNTTEAHGSEILSVAW